MSREGTAGPDERVKKEESVGRGVTNVDGRLVHGGEKGGRGG